MASPFARLWGVCDSPRVLRKALRRESRRLQLAARTTPFRGVGQRFDGAIFGEALVGTLSERLAQSLRWWNTSPAPDAAADLRHRTTPVTGIGDEPATRHWSDSVRSLPPRLAGTGAASRPDVSKSAARPDEWPNGKRSVWHAPRLEAIERAHEESRIEAALRRIEQGRGTTSDAPRRNTAPASALASAVERYWRQVEATATPNATSAPEPRIAPAVAARQTPLPPRTEGDDPTTWDATAPVERSTGAREGGEAPLDAPVTGRRWWSATVDAIHQRTVQPVAPPARVARAAPALEDDVAFADTLADVLRSQARAYGVDVL